MKVLSIAILVMMAGLTKAQTRDTSVVVVPTPRIETNAVGCGGSQLVLIVEEQRVSAITDFPYPREYNVYLHTAIQPMRSPYSLHVDPKQAGYARNSFDLNPLTESYASFDSTFNYRASIGVGMSFQTKRWYNRTQFLSGWSARETIDQEHPAFLPEHNRSYYWFNDVRTRTHFRASKNVDLSFGIDNHFIGEGYRSLLLSNQNAPTPFVMMRVNFWKLEYGLLYQAYHETDTSGNLWKFNAQHYLSWNATKNFNLTLVEQVVFQPKDGPFVRGFEVEYLNPIVFFRPQEYSLGSSDNVILGLQTSYRIGKHKIYGQLSLDEFVLDEIKKKSRWWANKYGAQLGVRGTIKNNVSYLVEGSFVRPYTYSHVNAGQNVGNMGLPTGHPLGSNFAELLSVVSFRHKISNSEDGYIFLNHKVFAAFQLKGFDADSLSWGGDIYESYVFRPKEYENTIGQGITMRSFVFGAQTCYNMRRVPIEYYLRFSGNYSWGELKSTFSPSVVIGVRSNMFQARRLL